MRTFFGTAPVMMNPPMSTLSPVCTGRRVEMLRKSVAGPLVSYSSALASSLARLLSPPATST